MERFPGNNNESIRTPETAEILGGAALFGIGLFAAKKFWDSKGSEIKKGLYNAGNEIIQKVIEKGKTELMKSLELDEEAEAKKKEDSDKFWAIMTSGKGLPDEERLKIVTKGLQDYVDEKPEDSIVTNTNVRRGGSPEVSSVAVKEKVEVSFEKDKKISLENINSMSTDQLMELHQAISNEQGQGIRGDYQQYFTKEQNARYERGIKGDDYWESARVALGKYLKGNPGEFKRLGYKIEASSKDSEIENLSFSDFESSKGPYASIFQDNAFEYLKSSNDSYFKENFKEERDSEGYLVNKDGTPANIRPSNIIPPLAMDKVVEITKRAIRESISTTEGVNESVEDSVDSLNIDNMSVAELNDFTEKNVDDKHTLNNFFWSGLGTLVAKENKTLSDLTNSDIEKTFKEAVKRYIKDPTPLSNNFNDLGEKWKKLTPQDKDVAMTTLFGKGDSVDFEGNSELEILSPEEIDRMDSEETRIMCDKVMKDKTIRADFNFLILREAEKNSTKYGLIPMSEEQETSMLKSILKKVFENKKQGKSHRLDTNFSDMLEEFRKNNPRNNN